MPRDPVIEVMGVVARAVDIVLRELQGLRDDVRDLHADIVQRDDVRHLARRVATAAEMDRLTEQLAALVAELQRSRARDVEPVAPPKKPELPAPAAAFSAEVSAGVKKLSDAARTLGGGMLDDLRARRGRRR